MVKQQNALPTIFGMNQKIICIIFLKKSLRDLLNQSTNRLQMRDKQIEDLKEYKYDLQPIQKILEHQKV